MQRKSGTLSTFCDVIVVKKKKDVEIREKALNLSLQKHNATIWQGYKNLSN